MNPQTIHTETEPPAADRAAVALYGHRLGAAGGTGISVYVRELITAVAASAGSSSLQFRMCGSPEPEDDPPPQVGLPLYRPPGPRKLLHSLWTTLNRPTVDRFVGHPDLIHVLYPSCPVPAKAPLIYTIHDLMPLKRPDWFTPTELRMFRRAMSSASTTAVALITDSRPTAGEISERLGVDPDRVHVVPLGVTGAFSAEHSPESIETLCRNHGVTPGSYLISVGAVSARKNLRPVITALAAMEDLRLVLAGPMGLGAQQVVDEIQRQGVHDKVKLTGWLAREELAALVAASKALVHPSLDEGFGMTPLEAMAAGIPAVVSDRGALPDTVGDAALVVGADDTDGWIGALDRLWNDPDFRSDLVARGRARAAKFTWARTAELTIEVYSRYVG